MDLLKQAVIYLAAATIVVPLSRRLGFGAVLGYLFAGVCIGPWGLQLVDEAESTLHFAELGVVLLMFVIGLELQPSRLWVLRRSVFVLGAAQVAVTGAALWLIALQLGLAPGAAFVVGYGLALSSTAFVLQMLAERKDLTSAHGRAGFGILLFQDLAVIPLIAILPLLAAGGDEPAASMSAGEIGLRIAALVVLIAAARYLLRPALRIVASAQIHEIFTAAALLLVIASALAVSELGLSMSLGAFLAGALMADSEYRHQLEADIEPFKGLLLGLFFVAVGMSANLSLLAAEPLPVLAITAGLIVVKAVLLFGLARMLGLPARSAMLLGLTLSQGGEFGFVLFTAAAEQKLLSPAMTEQLILAVTLSMVLTPLLYVLGQRFFAADRSRDEKPFDAIEDTAHEVVIAGFGRFGQIVGRVLTMRGIAFTALEASSAQVEFVRRFGNKIYYGDAARVDLLRTARVDKARFFVLAVEDVDESLKIAEAVRHNFPNVPLYARVRNRQHAFRLMDIGARLIVRDTLYSSLFLTTELLKALGLSDDEAESAVRLFREHDERTLARQHAIHNDEEALMQSAKESAAELRQLFESDQAAK